MKRIMAWCVLLVVCIPMALHAFNALNEDDLGYIHVWRNLPTNQHTFTDAAITAQASKHIGTPICIYLPPGTWQISQTLTLASNICLAPAEGALLNHAAGTLTISRLVAHPRQRVFIGTLSGIVLGGTAYPGWFGALFDGVTDDSAAIAAARAAMGTRGGDVDFAGPVTMQALQLSGSTSGVLALRAPPAASGTLTLPSGTTNFSATGGTSQVLQQSSLGGPFTVARLSCADLSDAGSGCGGVGGGDVLRSGTPLAGQTAEWTSGVAITGVNNTGTGGYVKELTPTITSPTLVTPTLGAATATSINNLTITQPASGATLTIPNGVTLNAGAGGTLGSNAFTSTAFVPQTTTVNGQALSSNVTLSLASSDFANQGTTTTVLHGNASGNPSFGAVALATDVSGLLPLTNGGLNANLTASNGGIFYSTASSGAVLAGTSTANLPLLSQASTAPVWASISYPTSATSGGIPYFSSTTAIASSGVLTASAPVIGGGAGVAPTVGTRSGTTTTFATTSGTLTASTCVQIDASGNLVSTGTACGSGGGGGSGGNNSALYTSTADATNNATASDTTLIGSGVGSTTTAANYFSAGTSLLLIAEGYLSTALTPDTLTFQVKAGSTSVASTGALTLTGSLTNSVWRLVALVTCRTTGVSGTFQVNTLFESSGAALTPLDGKMLNTSTITLDTTATQVWDVVAAWGATTAGDTITGTNFTMFTPGTGIADPGFNGILSRTGLNTVAARTLTGTSGSIVVTNGDGTAGNPTFDVGANIPKLDAANVFSSATGQSVKKLLLPGSTSGTLTVTSAAIAGTNTITLPAGTTDFSATGGTSQVVKQTSAGGAFTVAQLAVSDLSTGTTGSGSIVLDTSPTLTTPSLGVATVTTVNGLTPAALSTGFSVAGGTTSRTLTVDTTISTSNVALLNAANTFSSATGQSMKKLLLPGSSSGTLTVQSAAAAGTNTLTFPAGTTDFSATGGTSQVLKQVTFGGPLTVGQIASSDLSDIANIPLLNAANNFTSTSGQTVKKLLIVGSTSGTLTLAVPAIVGTNTLTFPAGTTDLSSTGGTSQVVKQTTAGGALTVARLACADLSDAGTGCSGTGGLSSIADKKILGNMTGASAIPVAIDAGALVSTNFSWSRQPGGSVSVGGNTVTLTPCPAGVAGTNMVHSLYLSGGTGTAEVVLITGGTCTSGAASGTITFTAANTHTGAWTIATATAGIQEAMWVGGINSEIYIPGGTHVVRGKLHAPHSQTLSGGGMLATVLSVTGFTTRFFEATGAAGDAYYNIRNLRISYASNGTSGEAIYLRDQADGNIENVYIDGAYDGVTGDCVRTAFHAVSIIPRNNAYNILCTVAGSIIGVSGPHIDSGNVSMQSNVGKVFNLSSVIAGMTITGFQSGLGQYGIFANDSTGAINELTISGSIIDGWSVAGIAMVYTSTTGSARWVVVGNTFGAGSSGATIGMKFSTTTAGNIQDITVSGNTIQCYSSSATCVDLQGVNGFQVTGNMVNNAVAGGKGIVLDGTATTDGVIVGNTSGVGLNRNDTNPFAYGIFVDAQAHTGIRIAGNYLKGSTADFQNNGTGAAWAVSNWSHAPTHAGVAVASTGFTETTTPFLINSFTSNGGSSPAAAEPVLTLARSGVGGQSYANYADVKLSRYTNSGTEAKTQVDFGVTDGNGETVTNTVLSLRKGGIVLAAFTFANIATSLTTNGQIGYCSDCTIANPCAGSGTGAIAKRLNGVNVCN